MTKHTCHSQKASTLLCEMSRQTFFRGIVSLNTTDETAIEVRCTFIINISTHISCYWHHIGENCDVSLFYWDTIAGTAVTGHTGVTCGIRSLERHSKPTQMHACDVWSDSPVLWWYTKHSRTQLKSATGVLCVVRCSLTFLQLLNVTWLWMVLKTVSVQQSSDQAAHRRHKRMVSRPSVERHSVTQIRMQPHSRWHCLKVLCLHEDHDTFLSSVSSEMCRDQPNSRFHGCDIFRETGLLPWKTLISVKSVIFCEF